MEIEFDNSKRKQNLKNHGIDFKDAQSFDWDNAIEYIDGRKNYGELRIIAVGDFLDRLTVMVYTVRNGNRRLISWRKANNREVENHG